MSRSHSSRKWLEAPDGVNRMTTRRLLKLIHVASTIWFVVCIGYILVLRLHEVGFQWWLIFSLSGQSVIVVFILISLYLFALFRGVGGAQQSEAERPFSSTPYYLGFYVAAPLLGGLAGIVGMIGESDLGRFIWGVAIGTLGITFCVWVVFDPLVGLIEMFLPESRKHRGERVARAEAERKAHQQKGERLLAEAIAREEQERTQWRQALQPQAERLAALLATDPVTLARAEQEVVDIGAQAWCMGGLNCMRQLRDMALVLHKDETGQVKTTDYISYWWDGIGDWRRPSLS